MTTPPIHVCFDIETLGGKDGAPIVQIGAVLFSPWGSPSDFGGGIAGAPEVGVISAPGTEFRRNVKLTDNDMQSATWATVQWWMTQTSDEARRRVFAEPERSPIRDALIAFKEWKMSWGVVPTYWWSDMDFDLRLMRQAYEKNYMATACPFGSDEGPHRGVRDFRTLRWIGKALGVEQAPRVGVEHDALDDAYHQAYYVIKVLRALGVEKP